MIQNPVFYGIWKWHALDLCVLLDSLKTVFAHMSWPWHLTWGLKFQKLLDTGLTYIFIAKTPTFGHAGVKPPKNYTQNLIDSSLCHLITFRRLGLMWFLVPRNCEKTYFVPALLKGSIKIQVLNLLSIWYCIKRICWPVCDLGTFKSIFSCIHTTNVVVF